MNACPAVCVTNLFNANETICYEFMIIYKVTTTVSHFAGILETGMEETT